MKKTYFIFFILFCVYVFFGWAMLDPDFGWRIQMGKLILTQGIPKADPFSFTMTQYPFVDHEWVTHLLMFIVYRAVENRIYLSFIFGFIAITSLYFAASQGKNKLNISWFAGALIFLVGSALFSTVGIRPQVWGWLLFIFWINEIRKNEKANLLILCVVQLLWVNTHGSFFLGIATYILYIISRLIQKKNIKTNIRNLILLAGVTMINPYGGGMWWEVWMSLSDTQLRFRIQEWGPGILVLNVSFWFYCVIFFSLLLKNAKKITLLEAIISLFFFLCSLASARNIPLFLLVSLCPCLQMWTLFKSEIKDEMMKHFSLLNNTLIVLFIFVGVTSIGRGFFQISPIEKIYPVGAVSYLVNKKAGGRIYAEYGWGGYIIGKVPSLKVFIDGRMPSWRWKQNDPKQSNNAAEEYFYIEAKKPSFEPHRKKYNITYALVRKGEKKNIFEKYKKIYEDDLSVIYKL